MESADELEVVRAERNQCARAVAIGAALLAGVHGCGPNKGPVDTPFGDLTPVEQSEIIAEWWGYLMDKAREVFNARDAR